MQPATGAELSDIGSQPAEPAVSKVASAAPASGSTSLAANDTHADTAKHAGRTAPPTAIELLAKRQAVVLELIAGFSDQRTLSASLMAAANEIQHRFQCERVAIGLLESSRMSIAAVSQQARIDARTSENRLLQEAMQEACDQDAMIEYPDSAGTLTIVKAHRALTSGHEHAHVCTIPLCHEGHFIGALLLQRQAEQSWARLTLELLHQMATMLTPLIVMRRAGERSVATTLRDTVHKALADTLKPRYLAAKSVVALGAALLMCAWLLPVTHHVVANAELVPMERRVITAPTTGFIGSAHVAAGDRVQAGQTLLRMDTRDLELQRASRENEIRSTQAESRAAMASHDRKAMAVSKARLDQARAQLALVEQQIGRAELTAPTDGFIIGGDLTQSVGAPVERGKVLLEMASADGYEVHLFVDEVDVPYVHTGQSGRLSLEAAPGSALPLRISAIHPVAQASGGDSRFLLEALLDSEPAGLRPGQTGVVKLIAGKKSLLWVWTHRFTEWAHQRIWEWSG